jgi:hypothetical protein
MREAATRSVSTSILSSMALMVAREASRLREAGMVGQEGTEERPEATGLRPQATGLRPEAESAAAAEPLKRLGKGAVGGGESRAECGVEEEVDEMDGMDEVDWEDCVVDGVDGGEENGVGSSGEGSGGARRWGKGVRARR